MENKSENKAKPRATAHTTELHAREEAELFLNMLLEAANDTLYAKSTCLLQLAKVLPKPDERPRCS